MTGIPSDLIERVRSISIEHIIEERGVKLRGADRARRGPCPICGGADRFGINAKAGLELRGCPKGGDATALVQLLDGCDFRIAVQRLTDDRQRPLVERRATLPAKLIWRGEESFSTTFPMAAGFAGIRNAHGEPGRRLASSRDTMTPPPSSRAGSISGGRPLTGEKQRALGPTAGCVIQGV